MAVRTRFWPVYSVSGELPARHVRQQKPRADPEVIVLAKRLTLREVRKVGFQPVRIAEGGYVLELAVVGVVAEFDVEIAEVIEQEDGVTLVSVGQDIARKVERIELLLGGEVRKIGRLHTNPGLTGEIRQNLPMLQRTGIMHLLGPYRTSKTASH